MMKLGKRKRYALFFVLSVILTVCLIHTYGGGTEKPVRLPESKVAIVQSAQAKAEDITYDEIKSMVREAVALAGGFGDLIKDGVSVVIKPNLVTKNDYCLPGWRGYPLKTEVNGNTTDWRIIKAIVELVREINPSGKIYVMEGSAGDTMDHMQALNYTPQFIPGVDEFLAIEDDSGKWQDRNSPGLVKVDLPQGLLHKEYYLNRKYKEADVLISVPCLKNHWSAAISGGIKNVGIGATPANIYGISEFNHGRNNMVMHDTKRGDLHMWIRDFYMCRPVDFVIMDGLQGVQNGPTPCYDMSRTTDISQDQMNMRLIIAGRDAVAVDTIEALLMGWDPLSVKHLTLLNKDGLGNTDTACINVVGKPVDTVRKKFAGRIPPAGGAKVTDEEAPSLSISKYRVRDGKLIFNAKTGGDINKMEIYIDNRLKKPVITSGFGETVLDVCELGEGRHNVRVNAYDRFLNRSEKSFSIKTQNISDGNYRARKASVAPVIDGVADDACWEKSSWRAIKYLWLGAQPDPGDFSGRYKVVWTPEKLYFLVEITDEVLSDTHKHPLFDYYKDDTLEIFIDEDHSHGDHTYNYNAFAYHIALDYNAVDLGTNRQPRLLTDHLQVKRTSNGNVHTWEIALDVYDDKFDENSRLNKPVTLKKGKTIGFALAYCDNDGGRDRESFIGSIDIAGDNKNTAWQNAGVFGHLTLVE